ncbi:hypothetical protein K9U39_14295 [Rhodoblastus acidophilus]|uniref:Uncharacterized protein n=1 Tax=Candidatus Rhodoblastus alkanivorans TaxID=2954117 RepID=A0ABS9ZAQ1_9HYPH|nr:hypothetical protein [Candidatus Rhodoblastus alkanivorans]MCI4680026.1 hypothetical protein [Candidatus Rhodoblastus alkanivorans]MCI4684774.1 hypothetical protein [Candidatus Rhodoblastus alkanivorans]MDI4642097.1 hypothetical protein [Rhodoblastus acidophilus]
MTELRGRYRIVNDTFLREKAARKNDPRHKFYETMLASKTYDEYLAQVGRTEVNVATFKTGPINGRMEILYARRSGWIADA